MSKFNAVLKMQSLWLVAAIGFHIVSFLRLQFGMSGLSLNTPLNSIIGLALFTPVIILGFRGKLLIYCLINGLLIGLVFYKGYLFQVLDLFSPDGFSAYPSTAAAYVGLLINSFGIPVSVAASYLALILSRQR